MTRWYRAYVGTSTDAKLAEAAVIAECSRAIIIATWHAVLESAADTQAKGEFTTTARRVAAVLCEPVEVIDRAFAGMTEVGLIEGGIVCAWVKRQFESDNSTERSRRHRAAKKKNDDATLQQQRAASPSVCVSVSVENTLSLEEEVTPARANLDKIQISISEAAGEMPCAISSDISPIVRLTEQGWNLEGHILPGIRDMARQGKRAGTWLYVANTLVGKAADIRAGPPPDAKPEPASVRFARKMGLN